MRSLVVVSSAIVLLSAFGALAGCGDEIVPTDAGTPSAPSTGSDDASDCSRVGTDCASVRCCSGLLCRSVTTGDGGRRSVCE